MTYRALIHLKYEVGLPTHELMSRFPHQVQRISEVALLDLPEDTLREIVREEEILSRLIDLKRMLLKTLPKQS